jgi:hypothetical protein
MRIIHQLNIFFLPIYPRLCQVLWKALLQPCYTLLVLMQIHTYKLHFKHLGISIPLLHQFLFVNLEDIDLMINFLQINRILCWTFWWFLDFHCSQSVQFSCPKEQEQIFFHRIQVRISNKFITSYQIHKLNLHKEDLKESFYDFYQKPTLFFQYQLAQILDEL